MKLHGTLEHIGARQSLFILACLIAGSLAVAPAPAVAVPAASEEYDLAPLPDGTSDDVGTAATQNANQVRSASGDGGGPSILLIGLAAVAAVCTGVAIWRLRKHSHHHT